MADTLLLDAEERMEKAVNSLSSELSTIRTGRASTNVLEKITVDYYGTLTPVSQVSSVTVPEARLLMIKPYEKTMLKVIEKAILASDLGITPANDGQVIRITFPQLTEERRKELAKMVGKYAEEGKVAIRNIRRDINDQYKKLEKNGEITEDDLKRYYDKMQKLTDDYTAKIDEVAKEKEKDILHV